MKNQFIKKRIVTLSTWGMKGSRNTSLRIISWDPLKCLFDSWDPVKGLFGSGLFGKSYATIAEGKGEGYIKTVVEKLEIHSLIFQRDLIFINLPELSKFEDFQKVYDSIQRIIKDVNTVASKGFLNHKDLSKLPVIKELLNEFTNKGRYIKGDKSSESYKWIFNMLMLSMLSLVEKVIKIMEQEEELKNSDLYNDYEYLRKVLFSKIDSSIRRKIQKRGITITQNIYTGFDTEYKNIDTVTNKLLTVQLAVNTKTILKLPKNDYEYELCKLDPSTGKAFKLKMQDQEQFDYEKLILSINKNIKEIRDTKFAKNDESILILIEGLKNCKVSCIEREEDFVFDFPRTETKGYIYYNEEEKGYSFEEMVNHSNLIGGPYIEKSYKLMIELLNKVSDNVELHEDNNYSNDILNQKEQGIKELKPESLLTVQDDGNIKDIRKMTRTNMTSFTKDKISVTRIRLNYFIAHLTNADLSILNDFDNLKHKLDIVNKSFVTLGKPIVINNTNVIIRDTMLLAPSGNRSLDSIGGLYGENKIMLTKEQKSNMDVLLKQDKELFDKYAIKDALITLKHGNYMEDFQFNLKGLGVPITLSSLGRKYVLNKWSELNYGGYQINQKYLLGDVSSTITPKGLLETRNTGLNLNYYIGNYKGGRNESFMYGVDVSDRMWYDYDIIGAYTTVLSMSGNPDYNKGKVLTIEELSSMEDYDILYSYTIIKGRFCFTDKVKYPSIPCFVDETTTVYPLKGECILTGSEYILARNQGCKIDIDYVYYIPFESVLVENENKKRFTNQPFNLVIKELQSKRREYPKGHINNSLYKEIGNSVYGLVVKGISDKRKFDIKTGKTLRMEAGELSNPIIGSWTTGYIRSVIGECLHNISKLKGKIVSVTTDGFISDIDNLEEKLIVQKECPLLNEYKNIRRELSGNDQALEIKHFGKGMISWTTRGQLSKESRIKATTGFQSRDIKMEDLEELFKETMKSENKTIEFIQSSLRSANDIYKKGGHVTMLYKDQLFRLQYDNRRRIIEPKKYSNVIDFSNIMLDSKPLKTKEECLILRSISKMHKTQVYNKETSVLSGNKYKDYTDLAIRNYIKGLFSEPIKYNLDDSLKSYDEIINFVKGFKGKAKISKHSISKLKNRKMVFKQVPRTKETLDFVEYLKTQYKRFDDDNFLAG